MSRHKLVKSLDLDEELDDFDGGTEGDLEDDLNAEDKELLRQGVTEVRQTLGSGFPATDQEIEDSLYYYYYDTQKTINYLLNQKTNTQNKKSKKGQLDANVKSSIDNILQVYESLEPTIPYSFSAADFFKDSPWLDIPKDRQAEILIEPLVPPGRLLGGSSRQESGPPKSKLAAFAAARKKENQEIKDAQSKTSSVALLDKLNLKSSKPDSTRAPNQDSTYLKKRYQAEVEPTPKKYPSQQRRTSISPSVEPKFTEPPISATTTEVTVNVPVKTVPFASPSVFAKAMFGSSAVDGGHSTRLIHSSFLTISSNAGNANLDAFAGPSPDDVVLKAQGSAKGSKQAKNSVVPSKEASLSSVTQGLKDVTVTAEVPRIKSKNLDVVAEHAKILAKNAANFVVIGHVDAGKSTLMGRLLHDLKVVDQRTVDKYRKEAEKMGKASFALAWVLDQGTEERERGVTIDIANHKFETEKTVFTILDAPGHRDFIPNMIAGASQADFAILVIDASTGNFESGLKGQTKEHALLVRSMGVQRMVIAINKLDTLQWSQERYDEISQQVAAFLTAAGFLAKNISFVPCSGLTGDNIVHKATAPLAAWYAGPPLVSLLETSEPVSRAIEKPLRLTIEDIFRGGVQNPISVSGRIDTGTVQIGESILIMPVNQIATIKGLDVDKESAEWAVAGQNVVLNLADIEPKHLRSGDVICLPTAPIPCVKAFAIKLLAFDHIMPMHCEIHKGRLHAPGRISRLEAVLDKASGVVLKGKKPKLIKPGSVARVMVEVEESIPLESGSRVILRAGGETMGAGLAE